MNNDISSLIDMLMPSALKIAGVIILFVLVKDFIKGERGIKLFSSIFMAGVILYLVKNIEKIEIIGKILFNFILKILNTLGG
jgi:mannose/fructose/N-acetylgalactosamine-specific phosphotransferase system component IID